MKKSFIFLLVGVVAVLSLTFASWIVFLQFRPHKEFREMMITMASASSFTQDAGLSWSQDDGSKRVHTTLYTSGPVRVNPDLSIDHATRFRVVRLASQDSYQDLSGELRVREGTSYLTYAPPGPDVAGVDFDGAKAPENNVWVAFDAGELPAWGPILPGIALPIEPMLAKSAWTAPARERLQYLLSYGDIVYVEYQGFTELIDGVQTRILDGRFDEQAMEAFLLDLVRAKEGREPDDSERIVAAKNASQLARLTLRFWIGMNDRYLYRLQAAGGFVDEQTLQLLPVDVRIEFRDFNNGVEVEVPHKTTDFGKLFEAAFGSLPSAGAGGLQGGDTLVSATSARLPVVQTQSSNDPDGDGLDNILEAFYGTSRIVADTDGDGMSDGDEVRSGRNPRGTGSLFGFGL